MVEKTETASDDVKTSDSSTVAVDEAIDRFLAETTERGEVFTTTAELLAAARAWADRHNAPHFGRRLLAKQLHLRGCTPARTNARRGWRGIKLR